MDALVANLVADQPENSQLLYQSHPLPMNAVSGFRVGTQTPGPIWTVDPASGFLEITPSSSTGYHISRVNLNNFNSGQFGIIPYINHHLG